MFPCYILSEKGSVTWSYYFRISKNQNIHKMNYKNLELTIGEFYGNVKRVFKAFKILKYFPKVLTILALLPMLSNLTKTLPFYFPILPLVVSFVLILFFNKIRERSKILGIMALSWIISSMLFVSIYVIPLIFKVNLAFQSILSFMVFYLFVAYSIHFDKNLKLFKNK